VNVKWNVVSEISINNYAVEKSTDGISYKKIGSQLALGNDGANYTYQFDDPQLFNGDLFYRIRSYSQNGEEKLSNVAKIRIEGQKADIKVLSNPIVNNQINIGFINLPKGKYTASIYDNLGQLIYKESITHNGDAYSFHIFTPKFLLASGIYNLKITSSSGHQFTEKLTIK
jgi:hypothetical protein